MGLWHLNIGLCNLVVFNEEKE